MKKIIQISLIIIIFSAISCKPEYPVPVFDNNKQIKYFIHEKEFINNDSNDFRYHNDTTGFEYDDKNRLISIFRRTAFIFPYEELYSIKYKKDHILLTEYTHNRVKNSMNKKSKIKYYLDENGNIIEYILFDADNKFIRKYSFEYNKSNQLTAYYVTGELMTEYKYFGNYFQIISSETNSTSNFIYGDTKSNLSLFFYGNHKWNQARFLIFNKTIFNKIISNVEYSANTLTTNIHYKYNSDSLITEIINESINNSKDTIIQINKTTTYYKIIY